MDREAVTALEEAKMLIRTLNEQASRLMSDRNNWELKYWQMHNEVRKANKGTSRLVYWKAQNKDMIRHIRGEIRRVARESGDNKMIYSPIKVNKPDRPSRKVIIKNCLPKSLV